MAEKETKTAAAPEKAAPAPVAPAGPAPHPSLDIAEPTNDPAIIAARGRAVGHDDEDDNDADLDAVSNIGAPVGKPIPCVVKKKFYSEEGQIMVEGKPYHFQLREGQTFPSDVLEPVDPALSKKLRKEFKARKAERNEARIMRERARDAMIYAGLSPASRARVTTAPKE